MKNLFFALALMATSLVASAQVLDDTAVNLTFSGRLNTAKATTMDTNDTVFLAAANGNLVHIAGTTTITSFGTAPQAGIMRHVIFDGVTVLTHNSTTLVIPGGANVTTGAGDYALVAADSTSKWIIVDYRRRSTAP